MWQDMKLYWAWRGKNNPKDGPPTKKTIDYVTLHKGTPCESKTAIGVWDNDKYTPLFRDELEFHLKRYAWEDEVPFPMNGTPVKRIKGETQYGSN